MPSTRRVVGVGTVLLLSVGLDQATKAIAHQYLSQRPPISLLNDTLRLQFARNTGAFLSLGSTLPHDIRYWLLTVSVAILLSGLLIVALFYRKLPHTDALLLALVIGGGASNLYDRMIHNGAVTDFLNVGIGRLRTGVFNLADVVIMLGVGILLLRHLRSGEPDDTPR